MWCTIAQNFNQFPKIKNMKKITYALFIILISMSKISSASMVMVGVENFVFNPANITVNVGDTIMWMLSAGTHTTTSTNIPVGAASWDAPINTANQMFMYQVTVEGEYEYICSIHESMGMIGRITVLGTSGINSISETQAKILNSMVQDDLKIKFNSSKNWQIGLMSLTGAMVKQFSVVTEAGRIESFSLSDLPNGIYIIRFSDGQASKSQRIIKQ